MAVITFVQSASANGQSAANAGEPLTFATTPVQGNFMLFWGSSGSIHNSPPSGYSLIEYSTGNAADLLNDFRFAGASEPTSQTPAVNSSLSQNYQSILGLELNGVNATPVTQLNANGNVQVTSNQWVAPSVTTSALSSVFAAFSYFDYQGLTSFTPPSGWTMIGPINSNGGPGTGLPIRLVLLYQLNVQAGTYNPALTTTGTPSENVNCNVITTAIQPVSGTIYTNNVSDTFFLSSTELLTETSQPLVTESGLYLVSEQNNQGSLDSISNNNIFNRVETETLNFSDSALKSIANSRNTNETFNTANALARSITNTRTSALSGTSFSDSINTTTVPYSGAHTYTINLVDYALAQAPSDLLTENNNALTTENNQLLVSEQSTLVTFDSLQSQRITQKATADTFFPSDSQTRLVIAPHNISDTFTTVDALTHLTTLNRSSILNGTITDSNSRFVTNPRAIAEPLGTTDGITHFANDQYTISETLPFANTINRQVTYYFNLVDNFNFLDNASGNSGKLTTFEENFNTQDSLAQSFYVLRNPFDTTGGESDFLNNNSTINRNPVDSSPTSDFESNQLVAFRNLIDQFSTSDYNNLQYLFNQSNLSDNFTLNDNLISNKICYRVLLNSNLSTDILHQNELTHVSLAENLPLDDLVIRSQTNNRYFAQVSFLNVNVTSGDIRHDFLSELFHFNDTSNKNTIYFRNATESFNFTDQNQYTKKKIYNFTETFNTSSIANSNFKFIRGFVNNALTLIDLDSHYVTGRNLSFSANNFSDHITVAPIHIRIPIENLLVSDTINRNLFNTRNINQTLISINDKISRNNCTYNRFPNESFSFLDYVFPHSPVSYTVNISDLLTTNDKLNYSPSIFGDVVTVKGMVMPNARVAFLYNGVVGLGTVQYIDWSPVQDSVVISVFSQYYSILNNLNTTSITVPLSQCALLPVGYR